NYARVDESQFQLLSCDQHRLPQQLRQSEQPRRQLSHDPRRLLVARCHVVFKQLRVFDLVGALFLQRGCYAMTDEQMGEIYSLASFSLPSNEMRCLVTFAFAM